MCIIHQYLTVNQKFACWLLLSSMLVAIIPAIVVAQNNKAKKYANDNINTSAEAFKSNEMPQLNYYFEEGFFKLPVGITFGEACGVDIDQRGHIYVLNRGTDHLIEFDANGDYVQTLAKGYLNAPHGLRIDKYDNIWVVDSGAHIVLRLDKEGHVTLVLGRKGFADSTAAFFNAPTDVAFGPNDEIFVSDGYGNSRIVKYDKDGNFIKTWGKA
ncbi:hypothetical protein L0Z72_03160, partial [candidate division KSB1 bacterium]|nr:hypothetical protein [candidate division KSB1 bacterium]